MQGEHGSAEQPHTVQLLVQLHATAEPSLVGVGVVVVVLDAPGLEGVDEGHEHERAHNVLHQVVLVEGAVRALVANHKPLQRAISEGWFSQAVQIESCQADVHLLAGTGQGCSTHGVVDTCAWVSNTKQDTAIGQRKIE